MRVPFFVLVSLCMFLAACGEKTLFTPPERGASNVPAPPVADSVVTLVASLPYATLSRIAGEKLPQSSPVGGDGHIACLGVPYVEPPRVGSHESCFDKPYVDFRGVGMERVCIQVPDVTGPSIGTHEQCADYHWHADINKDGSAQVSRDGTALRLSQGIHVTGQAGVGGDLAGLLSLHGKNIDVHATPRLNLTATLDKQWCPLITADPVGSWVDAASVEIVGRNCLGIDLGPLGHPEICAGPINLGIANELNHQFDSHRDDLQKGAQNAIPCDSVKPKIAAQWHPFSIKIERDKHPPLYLNIQPKSAAFSGIIPEDDRVRVAVRVGAQTMLESNPIDTAVLPLPPLDPLNADQGSLLVNLQAIAPYEILKQQFRQTLAQQTFRKDLPAGRLEVRIVDVDIYPSKDSLALGIKIDAKTPGSWFDTKGWVYLSGKPAVVKDGKAVKVQDIHFASVVDSAFWSAAQILFQDEILKAIDAQGTFDLTAEIDKAANQVSQSIAKANVPGLQIKTGKPNLSLDSVYVGASELAVVAKLALQFDAEVTEAILK
ncbi:DUF4403 family protein [Bradyrhizobium yuanmingense]|uniref:DUF4403 family protein n=1 Tax=Bradyrhizobium yuanmingense TaxID=108015 RepID=UPI0012FB6D0D|nr:DUF4403 family protein [Bradyrhizobium yuanmingense]MVT52605.1 DUF4403 family protein [Bradyrhizobium yuanmingense]